jgi:hypothetical protein
VSFAPDALSGKGGTVHRLSSNRGKDFIIFIPRNLRGRSLQRVEVILYFLCNWWRSQECPLGGALPQGVSGGVAGLAGQEQLDVPLLVGQRIVYLLPGCLFILELDQVRVEAGLLVRLAHQQRSKVLAEAGLLRSPGALGSR